MEKIDILVCLIGEQPVPNLLPIRQYRPKKVVLVHSTKTAGISKNLERILTGVDVTQAKITNAFDIVKSVKEMLGHLSVIKIPSETKLAFNITGGTKAMSQAAYIIAQKVRAPILYLQSEGRQSKYYFYRFDNSLQGLSSVTLDGLSSPTTELLSKYLSIDDYLRVHGLSKPKYKKPSNPFEEQVTSILENEFSEIRRNIRVTKSLEIDMILRSRNNYAVAELKTGKDARTKAPIDQLVGATSREFLGTYTNRILILDQKPSVGNAELAKAYHISTIILDGYDSKSKQWQNGRISDSEKRKLIQSVERIIGKA